MESVEANGITIDTEKRLVTYKAQVYSLPKKEYKLLRFLCLNRVGYLLEKKF